MEDMPNQQFMAYQRSLKRDIIDLEKLLENNNLEELKEKLKEMKEDIQANIESN